MLPRRVNRRRCIGGIFNGDTAQSMCFGEFREVRAGQRCAAVALPFEQLLPLAHHAEVAVVDDSDFEVREAFLRDGRQFAVRHLETTVANNDPHGLLGIGDRRAHCRGK